MIGLMILGALVVYITAAWFIIKRLPSKKAKWIAVVAFVLIPTWDEIAGRAYFKYLCATEAGVKVYQTVELPGGVLGGRWGSQVYCQEWLSR